MTMENNLYERALRDRQQHTEFYLRGMTRETPAGRAYADMLKEIKQSYHQIHIVGDVQVSAADSSKTKKGMIIAAIVFLGWLICYRMIPEKHAVTPRMIYNFAACIALGIAGRNVLWGAIPFVLLIFAGLYEADEAVVSIASVALVIALLKDWYGKRRSVNAHAGTKVRMERLREKMMQLLPAMRDELQSWQQEWYSRYSHVIPREELLDYQSDEAFPPAFWWQIPPSSIREILHRFDCSRYGGWESRLVPRDAGKEFDATGEYSPLYGMMNISHEELMDYYRNECGCHVFDVISQDVALSVTAKTSSYEVPAHSELERLSMNMSVMSLARNIDKAYNEGELSTLDYKRLANDMGTLAMDAAAYNSQTKTEYSTEYIPIHSHTNFWVGQFLLRMVNSDKNGEVQLALSQYYCQLPHMFKNLEVLDELNLVFMDYDPFECNPFFLAEFYSRHPDAY